MSGSGRPTSLFNALINFAVGICRLPEMMIRSTDITGVNIVETTKIAKNAIAAEIESQNRLANRDRLGSSKSSRAVLGRKNLGLMTLVLAGFCLAAFCPAGLGLASFSDGLRFG
jgi:hypothetical protein